MFDAPETRGRFAQVLSLGLVVLSLAAATVALSACGGDDDGEEGDVSIAELNGTLPTADDLGLDERSTSEWESAADLFERDLVIGGATDPSDFGAQIDDAGFQSAAGSDLGSENLNVRLRAIQFDSEEGALKARDLLHEEDLTSPCPNECIVTPTDYKLNDIPDSAAAHHVPVDNGNVEAHHAEFVIGSQLFVVQADGMPSATFSDDFDELMGRVYESASGAG